MIRSRMLVPALVVALALTPALAGCGLVQGAVEEATGGSVNIGGELPKGWPSEIPVVDGKILVAVGGQADGASGWVVTIDATGTDPVADAKAQLEAAGFTEDVGADAPSGDASVVAMRNDNYTVVVAGTADGLVYTVAPLTQ